MKPTALACTVTLAAASLCWSGRARAADGGPDAGTDDAGTTAVPCGKDSDCPGAACGGQVCHWPEGMCAPSVSDAGVSDPGWCTAAADCKCQATGAFCLPPSSGANQRCSFTTPRNGDAGTCLKDSDCPGAACGGQVCHFPQGTCVAAATDPGWCKVSSDCKCQAAGAVCGAPSSDGFSSCSETTVVPEGGAAGDSGADGSAATASSSSGGSSSSSSGAGGGSGSSDSSSGCNVTAGAGTLQGWGLGALGALGCLWAARRRRRL